MPHHKSDVEIPWDSFVHTMEPILNRVSRRFRNRYKRRLTLGSPVRVSTPKGESVRFPIEVRGGDREYSVATIYINTGLQRFYDENRLEDLAKAATAEAEKYPTEPPPKPGNLVLTYP